jgi:hypothetical protein
MTKFIMTLEVMPNEWDQIINDAAGVKVKVNSDASKLGRMRLNQWRTRWFGQFWAAAVVKQRDLEEMNLLDDLEGGDLIAVCIGVE